MTSPKNRSDMQALFIRFLRQLMIFTAIAALIALVAAMALPRYYITPALPFLFPFFMAATLLSFYYLLRASGERFIRFVNAFLLTIVVKLVLYSILMIGYALLYRKDAAVFLLTFFLLYLCYTIFESVFIIRATRPGGKDRPTR